MSIDWNELSAKLPFQRTAEQKKKRKELFMRFDPNGNGYLSLAEVDKGIRDILDCEALFDAKPVIIRAFMAAKNADTKSKNKHGADFIERLEFRLLLQYLRQYFEYKVMFDRIDNSGDGRLSLLEFRKAAPMMSEWGVQISDPDEVFGEIDTNCGGVVLFDEFVEWAARKDLDLEDDDSD